MRSARRSVVDSCAYGTARCSAGSLRPAGAHRHPVQRASFARDRRVVLPQAGVLRRRRVGALPQSCPRVHQGRDALDPRRDALHHPVDERQDDLLGGCFSGYQEKPTGFLSTRVKIMSFSLFLSRRYAAPQRKSRKPKSREMHEPSREKALRSPLRHLRQNRQRPRPVRGRIRRSRAEPAGHAPQVRRLLQDLGAGYLPQRYEDQPRPRLLPCRSRPGRSMCSTGRRSSSTEPGSCSPRPPGGY